METRSFDKNSIDVARDRIDGLFSAFIAATGVSLTAVAEVAAGDRAFPSRYRVSGMTFGTYDMIAGRLSALWPEGADWPAGIPRPAPVEVPAPLMEAFNKRLAQLAAASAPPEPVLPGGAEWPADIPKPGDDAAMKETANG